MTMTAPSSTTHNGHRDHATTRPHQVETHDERDHREQINRLIVVIGLAMHVALLLYVIAEWLRWMHG